MSFPDTNLYPGEQQIDMPRPRGAHRKYPQTGCPEKVLIAVRPLRIYMEDPITQHPDDVFMDKTTNHDQSSPVDLKFETIGRWNQESSLLLTINGGSSSLKFALFEASTPSNRPLFGRVDGIGLNGTGWVLARADGGLSEDHTVVAPDLKSAVGLMIDWLERLIGFAKIVTIGHRIVHGGSHYHQPERIDIELIEELRKNCSCDPDHLPNEIDLIETIRNRWPDVPQVVCFDTLVFTGGIGENATEIRLRVCDGLGFLGIEVDEGRNESSAFVISNDASPVKVRVIRTDDELMIAKSVSRILNSATIPRF